MPGHAPGFYFALHPTRCRAFILPCYNTAQYKRLQRLLCRQCKIIPPTLQNGAHGFTGAFHAIFRVLPLLYGGVSCYAVQPARRWRTHQRTKRLHRYQTSPPRWTLYRSAQPPYYNNVYKGAGVRTCYGSMPARRGQLLPCVDRWQVLHQVQGQPAACNLAPDQRCRTVSPACSTRRGSPAAGARRGGTEPLAATAAALFGLSPDS